jgi:parvulin-like peptidyl-prolyl isomerase
LHIRKIVKHIKTLWRKLFTDVYHKYRLVLRDESFREIFSFRLSRFNVIVSSSIALLLIVSTTILIIAFTPLKQVIPGYTRHGFVAMSRQNLTKIDSLENVVEAQGLMLKIMQNVIEGKISADTAEIIKDTLKDYSKITYRVSIQDSLLRKEIEARAIMTNVNVRTNRIINTATNADAHIKEPAKETGVKETARDTITETKTTETAPPTVQ